jgi:PAS domain S-box-containing protein
VCEGANYLAVCDRAAGAGSGEARRFADAIGDVSQGRRAHYTLEYACHAPAANRWFVARIVPLVGAGPKHVVVAHVDVTELRAARQALAASERHLRAIFEQAPVGMCRTAPDGRCLDANPHLCRLLGYTRAQLLGMRLQDCTHPEDRQRDDELRQRMLAGDDTVGSIEQRHLRQSGEVVWVSRTASLVRGADGAPDYFVSVVEDIGERRHAEEQARKLASAVEQTTESIAITDLQGRLEYVNEAFVRVSGYGREELLGRNPRILQSGRTPQSTYRSLWAALAEGRSWHGEFHNRRKDGSEYVESALVSPIRQADGRITHYVAAKRDITETRRIATELDQYRHRLEALVAERTAELEEARSRADAANQAKSAFLATMSHEIRTPMNGVLGMLEVLARGRLSEPQLEMVRTAQESGRTLLAIIDDILDFSKIEAGRMQVENAPVSIAAVVESLCDSMAPLARRRDVALTVYVAPEIPQPVLADALRLRQILFNLIGNAIKFSAGRAERRGRVAVRVTVAQRAPLRLAFAVIDNGIGMADEEVARLFVPFSQAHSSTARSYGGTGLGLTICRRLAELMQGEIAVSSRPGLGSTFTLALPVETAAGDDPAPRPQAELDGVDCLVVASDEFDGDGVCSYLAHAGARVRQVDDDAQAERLAAKLAAPVVVVRAAGGAAAPPVAPELLAGPQVRQVWIARGRRRRARIESAAGVTLDGDALRRQALVHAVAVAAGRAAPQCADDDPGRETAIDAPPPPSLAEARARGELILVAEDDPVNAEVLRRQLELLGRAAEFATDGAEALRMWRAGGHALLLTDLHMPGLDGYELAAQIRAEAVASAPATRHLPIVALTANALRGEAEKAKSRGIDDYLTKPLPLERLRQALERWLPPAAAVELPAPTEAGAAVFDPAVLHAYFGHEPATLRSILSEFLRLTPEQAAEIAAAAPTDSARIAAAAHKLKSAARAVGALALGQCCAQLERAAQGADTVAVAAAQSGFASAWRQARRAIEAALAAH